MIPPGFGPRLIAVAYTQNRMTKAYDQGLRGESLKHQLEAGDEHRRRRSRRASSRSTNAARCVDRRSRNQTGSGMRASEVATQTMRSVIPAPERLDATPLRFCSLLVDEPCGPGCKRGGSHYESQDDGEHATIVIAARSRLQDSPTLLMNF
jgi:hypothetical protein